jgi:hypothetical protein
MCKEGKNGERSPMAIADSRSDTVTTARKKTKMAIRAGQSELAIARDRLEEKKKGREGTGGTRAETMHFRKHASNGGTDQLGS